MGGRPQLVLDRDQVRRLRKEDKSLREISDAMGLSLTTTARIRKGTVPGICLACSNSVSAYHRGLGR